MSNTISKKDMYKKLKELAESLPDEGYFAYHKYTPGSHFNKENNELIGAWEQHKSNHYRRLKNIWNSTGSWNEIQKYFLKFNMELKYEDRAVNS